MLSQPGARIMGIVNVTPDSFSGDGIRAPKATRERGLRQIDAFLRAGADVIDIGGESTRPGGTPVSAEQEASRILPLVSAAHQNWPDLIMTIDTRKSAVARKAIAAGGFGVNDVSGLEYDPEMPRFLAEDRVSDSLIPIILVHNSVKAGHATFDSRLGGRYEGAEHHLTPEQHCNHVLAELRARIAFACERGIRPEQILVDPGIGFGKSTMQNLYLLANLDRFRTLGFPVVLGGSRKRFIGDVADASVDARLGGSLAVAHVAMHQGAKFVRVHDVEPTVQMARMTDALSRQRSQTSAPRPAKLTHAE